MEVSECVSTLLRVLSLPPVGLVTTMFSRSGFTLLTEDGTLCSHDSQTLQHPANM